MNDTYFKMLSCQSGLNPTIQFSSCTNKYYIYVDAEIDEDGLFSSVVSNHEDTIEKAMESFNKVISGKTLCYTYQSNYRMISIPEIANK